MQCILHAYCIAILMRYTLFCSERINVQHYMKSAKTAIHLDSLCRLTVTARMGIYIYASKIDVAVWLPLIVYVRIMKLMIVFTISMAEKSIYCLQGLPLVFS